MNREVADLKRAAAAKDAETTEQLLSAEVSARVQAEATLTEFQNQTKRDHATLMAQIQDLEDTLSRSEQQYNRFVYQRILSKNTFFLSVFSYLGTSCMLKI